MSKPFEGLKVYYSGSINGATEPDPDFRLRTYQNLEQAQQHIFDFLTPRK
jgi:hypothetical protein